MDELTGAEQAVHEIAQGERPARGWIGDGERITLILEKQTDHTVSADVIMAVIQRALDDSPMLDTRIKVIGWEEDQ